MEIRNIPFSPPDITEAEIQAVGDALRSGWITTGPRTKQLESRIARYVGAPGAVCLNSQSACAELTLRLLGIGEGDEVIVPAYTYTATASAVCHVGAKVVMVDCGQDSLEMDYDALERSVTPRTKAIVPVDIAGIPCDYDRLFAIAEENRRIFTPNSELQEKLGRIAIIADGAHALGASRKGEMVGSIGDFTNFSFHAVKNLTTAEGGAMTWKPISGVENQDIYRRMQLLSLHGQSKDALAKTQLGAWEYDIVGTWYKCNMTDVTAALGLAQFDRYPQLLARRKAIVACYDSVLVPLGVQVLPHFTQDHISSAHLYITRIPGINGDTRNAIIAQMADRGIACNVHYKPLPMHTAYREMGFAIKDFPNAFACYENAISLPLHTLLSDEDAAYVAQNFAAIVKEYLP